MHKDLPQAIFDIIGIISPLRTVFSVVILMDKNCRYNVIMVKYPASQPHKSELKASELTS